MGSADEVNIQASELNRTMKVSACVCYLCDWEPCYVHLHWHRHTHYCGTQHTQSQAAISAMYIRWWLQ